jgi:DNA-binding beta-propeller fold protein YncE
VLACAACHTATATHTGGATCTTIANVAPALDAASASVRVPGNPFGVIATSDGLRTFVSLDDAVAVLATDTFVPQLTRAIHLPAGAAGMRLTHDGAHLLVADGGGAIVIDVVRGRPLATMSSPTGRGAVEVVISTDDRFAFVSLEISGEVAVFDLSDASFVGSVALGMAPVGLALSPDGSRLYATSETVAGATEGALSVIDVALATSDPANAVIAAVDAGCSPVRVVVSAANVWVTARGSNALLGFSADLLTSDPANALVATVAVGVQPVGLALLGGDHRIAVADSNRSSIAGATAELAIVDVDAALAGQPALLGSIATGRFPRELAVLGSRLFVTNYTDGVVEAVDLSALP